MSNKSNILSKLFKLKIYQCDGQEFENLFIEVQKAKCGTNFNVVRACGQFGDEKNDGYNSLTNEYYQVYGPEDILKSLSYAISKLNTDVPGLMKSWKHAKKIYYVVNDKFKGLGFGPNENHKLQELNDAIIELDMSLNVGVFQYTAHDLSNDFLSLSENQQESIVGNVDGYDDSLDELLTYADFSRLFKHILTLPNLKEKEKLYPPKYDDKLIVNNFSEEVKCRLKIAHLNHGALDDFFDNNESGLEIEVKEKLAYAYENGMKICNGDSDSVYFYIIEKICNEQSRVEVQAAESVINYYFESCDIYKSPEEVL